MKLHRFALALVMASSIELAPATAQEAQVDRRSFNVQQGSVEDPGHSAIPVVIWAPKTGTGLGLIISSHGTGAGPTAHKDTAEALADAGFVVVAPMHPGDNFQDDANVGKPAWFSDRSRHISKVIDHMLARWEGHERLAPRKIGIFGFSAGATTALISIGGVPDLDEVERHCATAPEFVCKIMHPQTDHQVPAWTRDPRIAAAVIAAPGIGFAFAPNGLKGVSVPVQLWSGSSDETVPYASNTAVVRRLLPRSPEAHSVKGAVHLSFLAPCTAQTPPFLCQDQPGFDRAKFHAIFNQSVAAFFKRHLR